LFIYNSIKDSLELIRTIMNNKRKGFLMRFFKSKFVTVLIAAITIFVVGCTSASNPITSGTTTTVQGVLTNPQTPITTSPAPTPTQAAPAATSQPTIKITSPVVPVLPGDVTVTVAVANFNLVNKLGLANAPGEGHIHYFMDVTDIPTADGKPAIPTNGVWSPSPETSYTFTNVPEGVHTIAVELVNNDHTPLEPAVMYVSSVEVTAVVTSPSVSAIPPEVTQYASDWPLPQGNYESTRATFTAMINSGNVNTLGVAWTMPLLGATSTNPIIMGNTVYLQDNSYNIWSIDFASGGVNWNVVNNHPWIGPAGVCVGWGNVYGSSTSYDLAAYDMNNGQQVWSTVLSNANTNVHSNIQPIPYNNLIFTSTGPHVGGTEYGGVDGYLWGIDRSTGLVNWNFSTTDSPNFFGHPEFNDGSGSWFPPSIDTNTDIIYWGTKNPGGFGYGGVETYSNGAQRPGPNLYSNCIIAQDSASGKLLWFNQTFPHDVYDHDFQNTPMLVTASNVYDMLGPMDVAIGGGKAGVVYAFDRKTGATLWSTPVGKHQNDTLGALPLTETLDVYPGLLGGIETHMAYADGVVYVPYVDLMATYNAFGLQSLQTVSEGTGGIAALDVNTGKMLWDTKLTTGCNFGAATVVNDLIFTSTYDGTLYALNRSDGSQVWTYKAPTGMGINAWPSVAKDTIIFPFGAGTNPQLVAFKLGATGSIPTPTPAP
jgi:outer membrane protein assembly factor BamB